MLVLRTRLTRAVQVRLGCRRKRNATTRRPVLRVHMTQSPDAAYTPGASERYSLTDAGEASTARAGAMYSSTGTGAADSPVTGEMYSQTDAGAASTAGVGARYSGAGTGEMYLPTNPHEAYTLRSPQQEQAFLHSSTSAEPAKDCAGIQTVGHCLVFFAPWSSRRQKSTPLQKKDGQEGLQVAGGNLVPTDIGLTSCRQNGRQPSHATTASRPWSTGWRPQSDHGRINEFLLDAWGAPPQENDGHCHW